MWSVVLNCVDAACLVWGTKCGARGNCWLYDGQKLRYWFNLFAACKTDLQLMKLINSKKFTIIRLKINVYLNFQLLLSLVQYLTAWFGTT